MLNANDPFYRPLWRRIVIVALCLGWGAFEIAFGTPIFALIFLAVGGYAAYRLLLTFNPDPPTE